MNIKKIGVLTFHRAHNYGAVLQTYALQKAIEKNGYECQIIDYRNPQIEKWFHNATFNAKIKKFIKFFLYHNYSIDIMKRGKSFESFSVENLNLSKFYCCAEDFKNDFDAIVVGSDQVWNLEMTNGDFNFFLPYESGAAKFSYAASFGKSTVSPIFLNRVRECLTSFKSLCVREQDGVRLIEKITGQNAERTADPTLLLNKNEWNRVSKPVLEGKKHVLLYIVSEQTHAVEIAKKLAEKKGCEVVYVNAPRRKEKGVINLRGIGPGEFLHLISNAECVVTTSFHGLILSINYNVPFLFELNNQPQNTNSRLNEVSNTYSLEKYRIKSNNIDEYIDISYDWSSINEKILQERTESVNRLHMSLLQLGE